MDGLSATISARNVRRRIWTGRARGGLGLGKSWPKEDRIRLADGD